MPLLLLLLLLGYTSLQSAQPNNTPAAAPPHVVSPFTAPPVVSPFAAPPAAPAAARTLRPPTPSDTEQQALLALRARWADPLGHLSNWSASTSCCSWRGVTCSSSNSSIISISLPSLSLSGTLSPFIVNFSSLSILDLASNKLTGPIPLELGSLLSLTKLQLGHNSFNGSIPGTLFNLRSLQVLQLENNALSGVIAPAIANLVNLRHFSIRSNGFTGIIPASITTLTKLSALYAANNKLNGSIPSQIGDLNRLVNIDLEGNLLTEGIPTSIGSLVSLRELVLSHNMLGGSLPVELGQLQSAVVVDLSSNSFNGSIPPQIGALTSLERLDLSQNHLVGGVPPLMGNLIKLQSLNLSYNNLSGPVPTDGILANFNDTSFQGNGLLCGPVVSVACALPLTSTTAPPLSDNYMRHMPQPYGGMRGLGQEGKITIAVLVGAFGGTLMFVLIVFCLCRVKGRTQNVPAHDNRLVVDPEESFKSAKLEVFSMGGGFTQTYEEIVAHAGYFDTAHVLGRGRFATVYKSDLPNGTHLAVKVFKEPISHSTFERELKTLHQSVYHVRNLLPIKGFYSNPLENAIFYDFMPNGTLYDVLDNAPSLLDWPKRLSIATGVSQALAQMHKGSNVKTLHKDLKSTNILLDETLRPFVSDYGLVGLLSKSIVETRGYTPPEFISMPTSPSPRSPKRKYTEKTDVYSFGVVLLELLTNQKPIFQMEANREVHLVTWVLNLHKDGKGQKVLGSFVVESCPFPEQLFQALNLAIHCLNDYPDQRPTMHEATSVLERLTFESPSIPS